MNWDVLLNTNGFSKPIAHILAQASNDAYTGPFAKTDLEKKWKCSVRHLEAGETQAKVFFGPESVIIAFRGTEPDSIKDWITDISLGKKEFEPGMFAHEGFLNAYDAIHDQICDACEAAGIRNIFVTGHSLGGDLADLCMWKVENENFLVKRVYTFGQARVFGWKAAQEAKNRFSGRKFRVVNRNDIVPRVPSMVRFRHTGTVAYINRHDKIQVNPGAAYIAYDRILGYRANILRSHFMKYYLKGTQ
jgi:hypothetical protein